MPDDSERLVVLLEARIRDFEKNMQKASGTADRQYGKMRRDSKSATRAMEADMMRSTSRINQALAATSSKIGSMGKAAIGGFVGGLVAGGIAGLVGQLAQVANGMAQIGDEAKRAGVSARVFQEWRFVAEQNRIGIDQMTDGLKELNLRADEFVQTGKGSASEAFQRLGYSSQELAKKLKDPSALMLEIIGRLGEMDRAAQIRISDELFGGSAGERFVELIDQGEAGIRATIGRAHELGIIMNDELIAKAAEIDRRFNEISNTVGMTLKSAIVSAADSLAEFIDGFREFENQRSTTLQNRQSEIMRERLALAQDIKKLESPTGGMSPTALGLGFKVDTSEADKEMAALKSQIQTLNDEENRIIGILSNRMMPMGVNDRKWTPPTPPPGGFGGSAGARDKEAEAAERQAAATRKLISDLEHELSVLDLSNSQREVANTLRRAGVDATSAEGQRIAELVTQIEAETEARDRQKAAIERQAQAAENFFAMSENALMSIVDGSDKAGDAVKKLAVQLALAAAQAALLDTGPLAGLFKGGGKSGGGLLGGILGGLFKIGGGAGADPWAGMRVPSLDGGGYTGSGSRSGGVDGKGGFPAILHPKETIIDHTKGAGSADAPNITYAPVYNVAQGADPRAIAELQKAQERDRAEFSGKVISTIQNAQKRRVI